MKSGAIVLLSLMLSSFSLFSHADTYESLPHCYKPTEPLWMATSYYKERYQRDVEEYQRCMQAFIESQENAVKIHARAAQKAQKTQQEFLGRQ